jgi:hypothetical protein
MSDKILDAVYYTASAILFVCAIMVLGCGPVAKVETTHIKCEPIYVYAEGDGIATRYDVFEHGGHLFIGRGDQLLHHPDCHCGDSL